MMKEKNLGKALETEQQRTLKQPKGANQATLKYFDVIGL